VQEKYEPVCTNEYTEILAVSISKQEVTADAFISSRF